MSAAATFAFVLALACAVLMGFAIQRGATCTVAAVDELLTQRRAHRLAAFFEASLWVAGGLLIVHALGVLPALPPGRALTGWTILGGALLGFGAWLNRACVFGAIARFGSGEWVFALTPLGFYLGCLVVPHVGAPPAKALTSGSPVLAAPWAATLLFVVYASWRVLSWRLRSDRRVWAPHEATIVIGLCFLAMLLLAGPWAYTDLLADLARPMAAAMSVMADVPLAARVTLAVALLAGASWGGWTAGRFHAAAPTAAQALRCLAGGALMGAGTLLIPGSNDGLILIGLPLLWPYAWAAFATMVVVIALAQHFSHFRHGRAAGAVAS